MNNIITPRHKDMWTGKHRGVCYEIVRWEDCDKKPLWNYYLVLNAKQLPDALRPLFDLAPDPGSVEERLPQYPYMSHGFADLDWHGGITFYEKECLPDGSTWVIRAGCDYNHGFDQTYREYYTVSSVLCDCIQTIKELCDRYPSLLMWCGGCGVYALPADGHFNEHGDFSCPQCHAERECRMAEIAAEKAVPK